MKITTLSQINTQNFESFHRKTTEDATKSDILSIPSIECMMPSPPSAPIPSVDNEKNEAIIQKHRWERASE